jgi:hypothetical protein
MIEVGILKNFNSGPYKAGVQLAGSITTYFDDISVAKNIPSGAMVIGNYVIVAVPGGNPRDACVIATWPGGSPGGGMEEHGNEYHDPDFATQAALAAHAAATSGVHGLKGEVGFSVYQTSDQTIAKVTGVKIDWHAKAWDVGSYFDLTNNWYKPLVAGRYLLTMGVQIKSLGDGADLILMVYKNAAFYKMVVRTIPGTQSHAQASGCCLVDMNGSTDYVDLTIMHYDTVDRTTWGASSRTWFQGFLVAQT